MSDAKGRVILPLFPPRSEVTIQQLDAFTLIFRRPRPDRNLKMVLIPVIDRLPDDPEWEKVENAFGSAVYKKLRPPKDD